MFARDGCVVCLREGRLKCVHNGTCSVREKYGVCVWRSVCVREEQV